MQEDSSRKSSRRSYKSNSDEANSSGSKLNQCSKAKFACNWNIACKALFLGLMLMFFGITMATIGYFANHMNTTKDVAKNDTVAAREKGKLNVNNILTYVGPMIMGAGGFIVVAACVMTFEQRDSVAKGNSNRFHLNSAHGHSINRHTKFSPSTRLPAREGSGRRPTPIGGYLIDTLEDFSRRDLTADFIQFSRNLQQANIEKTLSQQVLGRSPSAPNLAASPDLLSIKSVSPRHTKHSRNSLHPLIGQSYLSPHSLRRQALSVDNTEYIPQTISPPGSKRASRQGSTSTGRGSSGSLEAELSRRSHTSQASMMLDLHTPNDCTVSMKIRDRNRRSDTARRHLLVRQAPIEREEENAEKDSRCGSPQFSGKDRVHSSSTPHSRRESYSPRMASVDDPAYHQHRCRLNEAIMRGSSPSLLPKRTSYLRSNTVSYETTSNRRGSQASEASCRKGSADYNFRSRRKSSNTSDSIRYCSRTKVDEMKTRRSPPLSLKSFQEMRYISQKMNEQESKGERMRRTSRKNNAASARISNSTRSANTQSLSPDSISVSSSTTEGHSRSDVTSIEVETNEDDTSKKT